jgi:hypothetical protein
MRWNQRGMGISFARSGSILAVLCLNLMSLLWSQAPEKKLDAAAAKPKTSRRGAWNFIVAGDSRNCGDVVMPAIASQSAKFSPSFYWHLGDLRAIYKIDEDIWFAADNDDHALSCGKYREIAWHDFIEHQIEPFGRTPFYLGIGNHEVIPPKTEDEFKKTFAQWMDLPVLRRQRAKDKTPDTELYYHWIQGGVDFIYLDNALGFFSGDQLTWLQNRIDAARRDANIKSLVVGMHEALPDSVVNSHSMGDKGPDSPGGMSGMKAYAMLMGFHAESKKPVYVLASHSHTYVDHIFETAALQAKGTPLPGWVVGTAGAVRYALTGPDNKTSLPSSPGALTDVYGYLVGTVTEKGTILFSFQEIHESDVPQKVRERYTNALIPWCFAHNSQNKEPNAPDIAPRCPTTPSK